MRIVDAIGRNKRFESGCLKPACSAIVIKKAIRLMQMKMRAKNLLVSELQLHQYIKDTTNKAMFLKILKATTGIVHCFEGHVNSIPSKVRRNGQVKVIKISIKVPVRSISVLRK